MELKDYLQVAPKAELHVHLEGSILPATLLALAKRNNMALPVFNTTLNDEVGLLSSAFHYDKDTINEILLNGVRYSFLPTERKRVLEEQFRAEMKKQGETA